CAGRMSGFCPDSSTLCPLSLALPSAFKLVDFVLHGLRLVLLRIGALEAAQLVKARIARNGRSAVSTLDHAVVAVLPGKIDHAANEPLGIAKERAIGEPDVHHVAGFVAPDGLCLTVRELDVGDVLPAVFCA